MFWVLDVERFKAPVGGVAVVGEEAAGVPLAIMGCIVIYQKEVDGR